MLNVSLRQVEDLNRSASFTGQLTDVTQVDKFEISNDAYEQRKGPLLSVLHLLKVHVHL